ncbi:ATP-grasp domain-containing protein [Bacillus sp. BRMEA1]|uniref:ATP-grasp domain-containing protein n=1 Tax=Neobacillus endophyticus TaxID=2738405 RepID=UPI001563264E|nr:ATP-grasp domain-containing protein [Neobacillus endophyticus]NRD76320.1 ATP-grasp domain-containing protein [Neobacillus endophyticus]
MNILLCSAGRRVKLVRYFKEELSKFGGKVVATDCDPSAPALYFADHAEMVPRITDPTYIDHIKQICKKFEINAVLSLIDPELSLLAEYKEEFERENIKIIISDKDVVNICFDKYRTFQFLQEHSLPAVPTYQQLSEILFDIENNQLRFPLIMKPKNGSASMGITIIHSQEELCSLWKDSGELIVQPFIEGSEYGVDCYVDLLSYKAVNIFCKRKIRMRAGETDKSVAVNDQELLELINKLVDTLKPIGPIDIDCFKTEKGFVISEINPRFGGGYPHAHEERQNFVRNIIHNLKGLPNQIAVGNYPEGSIMIKFDDVMVINSTNRSH